LPEQVWRCLLQVITAQESLLKRHATKPSDEWYTGRCTSPLKTPHAQNTHKTTLGILLHETKIDHLLPGRSSRVSSRWQCCFIHGITRCSWIGVDQSTLLVPCDSGSTRKVFSSMCRIHPTLAVACDTKHDYLRKCKIALHHAGGPAFLSGLQKGDVIVEVEGKAVTAGVQ